MAHCLDSRTHLAHHELESVDVLIIIMIITIMLIIVIVLIGCILLRFVSP